MDIISQDLLLNEGKYKKEKEYWMNQLGTEIVMSAFPVDFPRVDLSKHKSNQVCFSFTKGISEKIFAFANNSDWAAYIILLSGVQYLLSKYTFSSDVIIGMPVVQQSKEKKDLINNVLALRNNIDGKMNFKELLYSNKQILNGAIANQNFPYCKIAELLDLQYNQEKLPLINTILLLESIHDKSYIDEIKADIVFSFRKKEGKLEGCLEYDSNIFEETSINRIISHLISYFNSVTVNPDIKLGDINILTDKELEQILCEFNDTASEYSKESTIHQLFELQVERVPGNTAVLFDNQKLTYQELNERSNQVARLLRKKNIGPNCIVGIMLERSLEMIVGILGILKSGGAYMPIDPKYPTNRIEYMLKDSNARVLLTQSHIETNLSYEGDIICLDDIKIYNESTSNLEHINKPNDLIYVIYTSGSTGMPKGAMIEHFSAVNRIQWMQNFYPIDEHSVILQKTPITFDVSVWELFWWAIQGAKVALLQPDGEKDPKVIKRAIKEYSVTTIHFVPSMLSLFLDAIESNSDELSSLEQVFASGEALNSMQVNRFNSLLFERYGTKLTNLYGPTEATVDVSYYDCSPILQQVVPIGKPIQNIKLFVIDKNNMLQPVGVVGELVIAGDGLARGYLNNEQLTKEKFIQPPFLSGTRIYKTGDLVRWLPDGNIEFLGRIDYQVKIRGFRIEIGEIENQLLKYESIKEVIVLLCEDANGEKYLCAYYVADETLEQAALRDFLNKRIPSYMVPAYFVQIEQMPLNANGKVDRKRLLALPKHESNGTKEIKYNNELEMKLFEIWKALLDTGNFGIDDDFFSLGGNSITAVKLEIEMENIGIVTENLVVNSYRTIRELAAYIQNNVCSGGLNNEPQNQI